MGTEAQKAHRADYAAKLENAWQAGIRGDWTTDAQLRSYLDSQGIKGNPLYNQLYSKGGYATYGPSWDPGWKFDFNANQKIPYQGPGETWYDSSVASNWQNTDPLQSARMNGFFNWRDQNMAGGLNIDQNYGGNALAAWLQQRAKSGKPNAPDQRWVGTTPQTSQNMSGGLTLPGTGTGIPPLTGTPTPTTLGSLAGAPPPVPQKKDQWDWNNYSYSPF